MSSFDAHFTPSPGEQTRLIPSSIPPAFSLDRVAGRLAGLSATAVSRESFAQFSAVLGDDFTSLQHVNPEMFRAVQLGRLWCRGKIHRNAALLSVQADPPRLEHQTAIPDSRFSGRFYGAGSHIILRDECSARAAEESVLLELLAQLERSVEIPATVKRTGAPGKGLWFPHSCGELRTNLSAPGSELLLFEDRSSGEVLCMFNYFTDGRVAAPEDQKMYDRVIDAIKRDSSVRKMFQIDRDEWSPDLRERDFDFDRIAIGNLVAGRTHPLRGLLYQAGHGHMVVECRKGGHLSTEPRGLPHMIAMVLEQNEARRSHEKVGWKKLPIEPIKIWDRLLGTEVTFEIYMLRTYTRQQDRLIRNARLVEEMLQLDFVDQEPAGINTALPKLTP